MRWDPGQYLRYADQRGRPFVELTARIGAESPSYVVDLGCGTGELTALLADRWPDAAVVGVDSSSDMVETAQQHATGRRLAFECADLREWRPARNVDVVTANAVLQWVPGHLAMLADVVGWLAPGGWLAFQVPDNFTEPSHVLLRDLRLSARWRDRLGEGADRTAGVERPETYLRALLDLGLEADVWQTSYLHVLPGDDAVLEWVKGTALRPVLSLLDEHAERTAFLDEYAAALHEAYPSESFGTLFPFRRTFAVAHLPPSIAT
ncbi:MAG TPA: methyltransferase domain-containing protein [Mycobacteriales bacterium]|nr:methyltransferase domain-containing protein [Mycobacteriales bacterium]